MPDSNDPYELMAIWEAWAAVIGQTAGVSSGNVMRRAAQLMAEIDASGASTAAAERRLMAQLEGLGLKFPYRRPRGLVARAAMMRVVTELIDSHRIDARGVSILGQHIRIFDPEMLNVEPSSRPPEVQTVGVESLDAESRQLWVDEISGAVDNAARYVTGRIVLAEDTTLIRLDWGRPTELRRSVVHAIARVPHADEFFSPVHDRLVSEYRESNFQPSEELVAKHVAHGYDSPGHEWLAFHPGIARALSWEPSLDGIFRWTDKAGAVMVETLWWMDGFPDLRPHPDDEVGEGWLVTASSEAWEQIGAMYPADSDRTILGRRYFQDRNSAGADADEVVIRTEAISA